MVGQRLDVFLGRVGELYFEPAAGKPSLPANGDPFVATLFGDAGPVVENQMPAVAHHGVGQHIAPEDRNEGFQASAKRLA